MKATHPIVRWVASWVPRAWRAALHLPIHPRPLSEDERSTVVVAVLVTVLVLFLSVWVYRLLRRMANQVCYPPPAMHS